MLKAKHWLWPASIFTGASLGAWLMQRRLKLAGRVVLVTGASRGLGLYIARELADAGCKLCICARNLTELELAERDLCARGAEVLAVPCDVAERTDVERLLDSALRRFGVIDAVVNNAAILTVGPLESLTVADFEAALAANFWGIVYTSLGVLPHMRSRRSGRIVNITSIGGQVAVPHLLPYDAAKFAAVGFSEGLTAEVAKDGILVTTVVPGLMRTGSPVNVAFTGAPEKEYLWFALGDATSLTSMDGARAARRIVRALVRGETEVTLSWQAKLLRLAHGLAPSTTIGAMALINRLLPAGGPGKPPRRGYELPLPPRIDRMVKARAMRANQLAARIDHDAATARH